MQEVRARKAANGTTAAVALDEILQERRDITDKVSRPYVIKPVVFRRIAFFETLAADSMGKDIFKELAAILVISAFLGTLLVSVFYYVWFPEVGYMEILRTLFRLK